MGYTERERSFIIIEILSASTEVQLFIVLNLHRYQKRNGITHPWLAGMHCI